MKVLALIFSFNDADVIEQTIGAMLQQTRPVDQILVVDNASTDGTLEQPSLKHVTVLRHQENLGASGALCSGFRFALERDFDWIWTFDADAAPEPDALEKLLGLYASFPRSLKDETAFIACLGLYVRDGTPTYSGVFTRRRLTRVGPAPEERYYPCHVTTWSGRLYRLAAVRQIGLPNPDYFLDWGEVEYGYRIMKAGYKGFTYQDAVHHHDIRGYGNLRPVDIKRGAATSTVLQVPPLRCYYTARNRLYFTLYDVAEVHPRMILRVIAELAIMTVKLLLRPRQIRAFYRGIWHGVTGNIAARY